MKTNFHAARTQLEEETSKMLQNADKYGRIRISWRLWTVMCCSAVFGSGLLFTIAAGLCPIPHLTTLNCLKSTPLISVTIDKIFVSVGAAMKLHTISGLSGLNPKEAFSQTSLGG